MELSLVILKNVGVLILAAKRAQDVNTMFCAEGLHFSASFFFAIKFNGIKEKQVSHEVKLFSYLSPTSDTGALPDH